jgi:CRISPR type IV-associated protein Csf3
MIPLRVTFELMTPWVPPAHGVHLDGLLAWAAAEAAQENPDCTQADIDAAIAALPLAKHTTPDGRWCWKASLLEPRGATRLHRHFATAKTDTQAMAEGLANGWVQGKKTIDTVRGATKNDLYRYSSQEVAHLVGWCLGDQANVDALLSRLRHVGSRGRLGYGALRRDEEGLPCIQIAPADPCEAEHWRLRHLPDAAEGYFPMEGRCQPPYWHSPGGELVWRPLDAGALDAA